MIIKRMVALCMLSATLIHLPAYALFTNIHAEGDIATASKKDLSKAIRSICGKSACLLREARSYLQPETYEDIKQVGNKAYDAFFALEKNNASQDVLVKSAQDIVTLLKGWYSKVEQELRDVKPRQEDVWWFEPAKEFLYNCVHGDVVTAHLHPHNIASILSDLDFVDTGCLVCHMFLEGNTQAQTGVDIILADEQKARLKQFVEEFKKPCTLAQAQEIIKKFDAINLSIFEKIVLSDKQLKAIKEKVCREIDEICSQGALTQEQLQELAEAKGYIQNMSVKNNFLIRILSASMQLRNAYMNTPIAGSSNQSNTTRDQKIANAGLASRIMDVAKGKWYLIAGMATAAGCYALYKYAYGEQEQDEAAADNAKQA